MRMDSFLTLPAASGGFEALDYLAVGVYLAAMLGMGVVIARRQKSTDDFFTGGRNMPAWAVGFSMFATLLSTITYLGMPGEMFRTGLAFLTRQLPIPLVLAVVWLLWIPFFMRLELTSAYEYLERRFNYATRALAAVFCLLLLFGWISVVVLTASQAMAEIMLPDAAASAAGWDRTMYLTITAVGLFSVFYTTLGGIRAVVWTDVVQVLTLMGGAVITLVSVAWMTGTGPGDWIAASQQFKHEQVQWFDWDVTNRSTVFVISLNMFFWYVCTHGSNQVALQRYFTVSDVRAARRTYLVSAIVSILVGVLLAAVGISLMTFLQDHELPVKAQLLASEAGARGDLPDKVFPQFISHYLPAGIKGLVVAALFAAAMSTIDSGSNSASTIVTVDFIRPFSRREPSAKRELRQARILTATAGILVVAYTLLLYQVSKGTNIIDLCQKGFNCFLGGLGGLFVLAMFSRRCTSPIAIIALLCGEATGIMTSYSEELLGVGFSTHLVVPMSWLVTVLTGVILSLEWETRATDEQAQWMWLPVVRGGNASQSSDPE